MRLSQCPFAASPRKANSPLCSWESGVGTKFLALPLNSSRSLMSFQNLDLLSVSRRQML